MKRIAMFIIVLFFIFLPFVCYAFNNEPPTFRGMKWGININVLNDMEYVESSGDADFYIKTGDKMYIGEASLNSIGYGFYKGNFYSVIVNFSSKINFDRIKSTLYQIYGNALQPNEYIKEYYWMGKSVNVQLMYDIINHKV